ncbi:MAG TPA: MFS transporter [Nitrospiraceae bacterium]|nr:MFS transporter [Nitrospiraceae bacterium]
MVQNSQDRPPFHYGWVIVFTGTLCIFAGLGLGRFALGMLLPSMASTLRLTYSQMGFISTANFLGYLISVLVSGFSAVRTGARRLIFAALLLVGISMILVSQARTFAYVLVLYFLTGIGSGATNVPVMGLVAHWFTHTKRGKAAGFIVIGSGFAIIISGKLLPFINRLAGSDGWRISWLALGCIVVIVAFISHFLIRNAPEEKGLRAIGSDDTAPFYSQIIDKMKANIYKKKVIYHLGAIYFLFGYSYVIYATFFVTTLVKERGFPESKAGNLWAWIGFLSLFSGPAFGSLSDKLGRKPGLIIVFFLQMLSYLLIASGLPGVFLSLSIFSYGIVAWSIPSIMVAAAGDYVGAHKTGQAFGLMTFIFGFGQIAGPAMAGLLAEKTGSFSGSFSMAAASAGIAIVLACFLKRPRNGPHRPAV